MPGRRASRFGSYLAISDTTRDIDTERVSGTTAQLNTRMGPARLTLRSRDEIASTILAPPP